MIIAIIPARGGSKRIPGKNTKNFLGKPIISYSIEAAIRSGLFDEVMVSTDSKDIANTAREYGASIPFLRSEKNSDDFATTVDVLIEVINEYEKQDKVFEYICCIYPTAPLVTIEKLCTAYSLLKQYDADALVPVIPFSYPPLRGIVIENDLLKMKWPENTMIRSQDLEIMYHDSGQFYFIRTNSCLSEKTLFCKRTIPMVLSELEVQDIDNDSDWAMAEMKYKLLTNQR